MSDMMLNLDFSTANDETSKKTENSKHQQFVKKRRFLERKGLLHEKQIQPQHRRKPKPVSPQGASSCQNGTKHPFSDHAKSPSTNMPASALTCTPPGNVAFYEQTKRSSNITSQGHSNPSTSRSHTHCLPNTGNPLKYLAMDCEMVGTGPKGCKSELARCSIVSYDGDVVYDKYIKPIDPVTDHRTRWSGISRKDLCQATPSMQAKKEILKILTGKVVVGHAIHNDFRALGYSHPPGLTRDTSRIPLLNRKAGFAEKETASLKRLTKAIFNRDIQTGKKGHSSVEDAKATMELYKVVEVEWEKTLASKS